MSFKISSTIPSRSNTNSLSGIVNIQNYATSSTNPSNSFATYISTDQSPTGSYLILGREYNVIFGLTGSGNTNMAYNNTPVIPSSEYNAFTFTNSGVYDISYSLTPYKNYLTIPTGAQSSAINIGTRMVISNSSGITKYATSTSINDLFNCNLANNVGTYINPLFSVTQRTIVKNVIAGDKLYVRTRLLQQIIGSNSEYSLDQGGTLTILKL